MRRFITDPARMRAARERAGFRPEAVAVELGISYASVMAYERGLSDPSARVLIGMARLYGVPAESLCREDTPAGAR